MVTFVTLLLACVSVCISNDKCAKGNNKENEKNSIVLYAQVESHIKHMSR